MKNFHNFLIYILFCFAFEINAGILRVPSDYGDINAAIGSAADGDTIIIARGIYRGTIDFKGKGLILRSDFSGNNPSQEDIEKTIIEGNTPGLPVIQTGGHHSPVRKEIVGITVRRGSVSGIDFRGAGRITHVVAEENVTTGIEVGNTPNYNDPAASDIEVSDCVVRKNNSGINEAFGTIRVLRVQVYDNLGWGLGCHAGFDSVVDSLIVRNGNGITLNSYKSTVQNCTIAYNSGEAVWLSGGPTAGPYRFFNSIFWANKSGIRAPDGMAIILDFNCIQGGKSAVSVPYNQVLIYGANNQFDDPKFVAPLTGDFRLREDSTLIGAGGDVPPGVTGVREALPLGSALDLGAMENSRAFPLVTNFSIFGLVKHNRCFGGQNGSIQLHFDNGTEPIAYKWTGPSNFISFDKDIKSIVSGDYNVVATSGDKSITKTFTVFQPLPLAVASSVCGRFPGVKLSLTASGGTPPYEFSWDNGGASCQMVLNNPGVYGVTVTDASGCSIRKEVNVAENPGQRMFYVSQEGDDSNPGTRELPLQNIQFAIDSACDNDTVVLSRGVYRGTIDFKGKGITLKSDFIGEKPKPEDIAQTIIEGNAPGLPVIQTGGHHSPMRKEIVGITVRRGGVSGIDFRGTGRIAHVVSEENITTGIEVGHTPNYNDPSASDIEVSNCVVRKNTSGINESYGTIRILRVQVYDNLGWGIGCHSGFDSVVDSLIVRNGNGLTLNSYMSTVQNCTIAYNLGEAVWLSGGSTAGPYKIYNSILWANKAGVRAPDGMVLNLDYNCIQGGKGSVSVPYDQALVYGESNRTDDPRFVAPGTGDYRLRDDSVLIGSGGRAPSGLVGVHEAEPNDSALDIGAFENPRAFPSVNGYEIFGAIEHNLCPGQLDGAIKIYVANGVDPINYKWVGPSGFQSSDKDIRQLRSGEYTVEVEFGGRFLTNKFKVREPLRLTLASTVCGRFPNVTLSLTVSGGTPPYQFAWDGGGAESQKTVRFAGVYSVNVTDASGCLTRKDILVPDDVGPRSLFVSKSGNDSNLGTISSPFETIQQAINSACDGDTVILSPGVYSEAVDLMGKNVLIRSDYRGDFPDFESINATVIDGAKEVRPLIKMTGNGKICGITFRRSIALGETGAAVYVSGNGAIEWCRFLNNENSGVFHSGTGLTIKNCYFFGNRSGYYGINSSVSIQNSEARSNGLGFRCHGDVYFVNCLAAENGGGIGFVGGNLNIYNSTIAANQYAIAGNLESGFIYNSIVSDNLHIYGDGARFPVVISNSLIEGGLSVFSSTVASVVQYKTNNIANSARFVLPTKSFAVYPGIWPPQGYKPQLSVVGDYRLRDDSPAVNAGDNSLILSEEGTDLPGKVRILGGRVDLGAYERWSFYAKRSLTAAEGTPVSVNAIAEDIAAMGGVKFQVESGPDGLSVDPSTGKLTWTPTEVQGPGTYTAVIRGTAVNNPTATDTQTLTLTATEVNQAPQFPQIAAQTATERLAWSFQAQATDPDLPANRLTYRLVSGPSGATVNADSGLLKWTPGEAEGGNGFDFVVEASDNGSPALSAQTTIRLAVQKVNHPPTLAAVPNASIPEITAWSYGLVGQDLDLPAQTISYSLVSGPAGMVVNPTTGVIQWTPIEAQGPGKYLVTVRVQDPEGLAADQTFEVGVTEVNTVPSLGAVPPQLLAYGQRLDLQLMGTDADLPANVLSYRLVSGPTNTACSSDGRLIWSPIRSQAPSTNVLLVALTDGALSVTNSIRVEVLDLVTLVNGVEVTTTQNILPPAKVSFKLGRPDWVVLYSLDGTQPTDTSLFYLDPFTLDQSATVWPIAFSPDFSQSVVSLPIRVNLLRSQTLTLTGGQGLVHQGPGVAISAASDSGLPVTVSVVSGPARLENGLLIPTGGGVVRLKATQAGNADWAPASIEFERLVAKAVQTIAWTPLPEATFRSAPVQLKATASSGLAVTYSVVDGPGSITADRLTLTGAGQVVVRATQVGSADFEPVTADQTVTVKKAAQTLTFNPIANRVLGTTPVSLVGSASSGLAVVYEVLSGPAKVSGDQLTVTGVGVVLVRASQPGDANYEAALPRDQQFTVTQGQQTLTFAAVGSRTFGDAPVTLSATSTAQLPVTYRVISGPGALNGDQLTLLGAGDIVVQASQAGNDQFQAVSVNQTITVAKAAQVITFPALASVGFSTNGVALESKAGSGLAVSYRLIAGNGTITGSKLALTGIGSFTVVADQAGNTNWLAATSVTNSFTVTRGVQSIAFAPIGDQVLSVGSVTLNATSSAGLAVTYSVMSGPATVSGNKLTLLNEGTVMVRAINPGSTLWQAAQADQTFQIRKLTTLSVTVAGNIGGTVAVSPVKDQYAPTDTVTLTATATNGFAFSGWSGDLTGAANPATLTMASVRSVTATFKDILAPTVVWDQPAAGITGLEQVRLSGKVSDNVGATSAQWSRDGGTAQALSLATNGTFSVENLVLNVGTNRFAVTARDAAGNETKLEREVVWVPQRVLSVGDAVAVQEGQRLVFPLSLIADTATVAGLTFKLSFDPAWVTDPQVEWGAQAGQSVNNVNIGTAGELTGSFALAGVGLPSGSNRIATVSFRARSVPFATEVIVRPTIMSLGSLTGVSLNQGNAAVSGSGTIRPRRIKGDNNANQRLDVGDAVLISRYEVGLEEKRTWDIGLNDLNQSGALDNGDVIKALRAVVGLDPQPTPGSESKRRITSLDLADSLGLAKILVNTNDAMALELIDGPTAAVGQPYRVAVRLNRVKGSLSGLSFTVKYPASLSLTDKQVGALVPGDALPFWNEGAGQVSLAAIRSTAWANATGVAAVLTFVPTAAFSGQSEWPLRLEQSEITGSGFDVRPVDPVTAVIQSGGGTVDNRPQITLQPPKADGSLGLEIRAPQGATVAVETTGDLSTWTESQRITGQGNGTPVKVTLQADPNVQAKFWRVRVR